MATQLSTLGMIPLLLFSLEIVYRSTARVSLPLICVLAKPF
jgi:uncharacterized membrane protein YdfJ with MMPL/SSD domain